MKKVAFRRFRYIECDDFAAFLEEMAVEGWHFKEWKWGLVFEKGKPLEVCYDVEVFPEGKEGDTRAEDEALEYAQYCEAAGWKFIDGRKRFCIFKKEDETACDIVSPEEKLANVKRAEWKRWALTAPGIWLICMLDWFQFLHLFFKLWAFNTVFLTILVIISIMAAGKAAEGIRLLMWGRRMERRLKTGEDIYYGSGGGIRKILQRTGNFSYLIVGSVATAAAIVSGQFEIASAVAIVLAVMFIVFMLLSRQRYHRAENRIMMAIWVMSVILAVIAAGAISGLMAGDGSNVYTQQSIFGSMKVWESNNQMEIYKSDYEWVLDRLWKQETKKRDNLIDCTGIWDAQKACQVNAPGGTYFVRYPGTVVIDRTGVLPNQEKIEWIKAKGSREWPENSFRH